MVAVVCLIFVVVGAGVARNDINYTSTGAVLVGALTLLAGGKKDGDGEP